jgi:OOP family OmpA-OmpF porin
MLLYAGLAMAQPASSLGESYPDGHGGSVYFPLGDISFADAVVAFVRGDPPGPEQDSIPDESLGTPDYDSATEDNYLTLGCGGVLTVRFDDNLLVDTEGADLYVFEVGPDVEPTHVSISADGDHWIDVGDVSGATADVDIAPFTEAGQVFRYVRLTDLKSACASGWPGADIDAVGAIGSALLVTLQGSVLFDFDEAEIKEEAAHVLTGVASQISDCHATNVAIEGHTDDVGTPDYNEQLSLRRAAAVRDYLLDTGLLTDVQIEIHGFGESRPVAPNETEEGRAANRRVEIVVFPGAPEGNEADHK